MSWMKKAGTIPGADADAAADEESLAASLKKNQYLQKTMPKMKLKSLKCATKTQDKQKKNRNPQKILLIRFLRTKQMN